MEYVISGERVGLGPLRRDLLPAYNRWDNDPAVFHGTGHAGVLTEDAQRSWYERHSEASAGRVPELVSFTVYDVSDGEAIGTAGLFSINHINGTATFGIMLGERRGQGLGTEATRLVVRYGFETLGLHNIMLTTLAWNEPAIAAYRRAGFEEIGVRRNAAWSRGERADEVLMQAMRPD